MKISKVLMIGGLLTISSGAVAHAGESEEASLYERLGGMPGIRAVVDDLLPRILADSRINRWFAHAAIDPAAADHYKAMLADLVCQATGGRCVYAGGDMATVHKDRGITAEAFQAMVEDITATLDKLNVPQIEKSQLLGLLAPLKAAIVTAEQQKPQAAGE